MQAPDPNQYFYGTQTPAKPTTQTTSTYRNPYTTDVPYGPYLQPLNYSPSTLSTNLPQNLNQQKSTFIPSTPTQQPASQPASTGPSTWDMISQYYQGWNQQQAMADFSQAFGGDLNRLKQSRGISTESADEIRRREDAVRDAINMGYGEYEARLRGMQSGLENSKNESLNSASKIYEQLFGGLTEQKQANLDKLAAGKQEVQARQASSIKDLQTNLSNVLRSASMQFGAMGAGDTSATRQMLPYAYTKLAGQQEGSIRNQSNDQLFQIDQEGRDTERQFSDLWRQTEVDKETSLQGIRDYYSSAIQNVQTAMAQAPLNKAQALASLNQQLLSEAQANLRQLEAEDRQKKENLKTWATNRMSELNNLKLQLSGSANFKPQDIVWNELSLQGATPGQSGQGMDFSNYVTATRKKYLGQ